MASMPTSFPVPPEPHRCGSWLVAMAAAGGSPAPGAVFVTKHNLHIPTDTQYELPTKSSCCHDFIASWQVSEAERKVTLHSHLQEWQLGIKHLGRAGMVWEGQAKSPSRVGGGHTVQGQGEPW